MIFETGTLAQVSIYELVDVFNASFAGYPLPISFTPETLADKMRCEGIDLHISAGAFSHGKLVAFMLFAGGLHHGLHTVWNGGTGVLPEYRGHALTQRMYEFICRLHKANGFEYTLLEVLEQNTAARKSYTYAGLHELRMLNMYKAPTVMPGRIAQVTTAKTEQLPYHWYHWQPSWQHTAQSIARAGELYTAKGFFQNNELQGYCVYNAANGRIVQLAVNPVNRMQGIATRLIEHVRAETGKPVSMLNVDVSMNEFARKLGFECVVRQVEMGMYL